VVVNARNFKTRDTEREVEKNMLDTEELNAKLKEYVDTIKVYCFHATKSSPVPSYPAPHTRPPNVHTKIRMCNK
jgi:hypothetical protein